MSIVDFKKKYFTFLSINISLIPLFLITGPFLSDLSLSLCALTYILYAVLSNEVHFFKKLFFKLFLIFYSLIVLSSLFSENTLFSLKSSLPYIRFGLFVVCVWHTAREDAKLFDKIFFVLTLIYLLLIFDSYLQFITGTNLLNFEKVGVRVSSFFGDELVLGSYVTRFFPIYVGLYFYNAKKRKIFLLEKIAVVFIFILISILVIITGERTAFILYFICLILIFFFIRGLTKMKFFFILAFIVSSLLFISFNEKNFERLITETKDQIFIKDKIVFYGERRHEYANVSINIFKDNIIFGSGPKTYRIKSKDDRYRISDLSWNTHPHNIYFQLLAETGLLGTIFIFSTFIYLFILLFRNYLINYKNKKDLRLNLNIKSFFIIAIVINIFPLVPSGNFFNNWMSIVFFYPVALYFAYPKLNFQKNYDIQRNFD